MSDDLERIVELHRQGKRWSEIDKEMGYGSSGDISRKRFRRSEGRTLKAELAGPSGDGYEPARSAPVNKHPNGWEPGIDTARGVIVAAPSTSRDVRWDEELTRLGFSPDEFEIVEPYQVRTWDGFIKNAEDKIEKVQLWYRRASIIRRRAFDDRLDMEKLTEFISAIPKPTTKPSGNSGFVFVWSDAQIGKSDGDGTTGVINRMMASLDAGIVRLEELKRLGRKIETVHLHIAADLYEATSGHYPMQTYGAELNLREQRAVARRLVLAAVTRFAALGLRVLVTVVPGNHTENRQNGKAYTTFGDNGDIEVVEQVAEICAANPKAYGNVRFIIPKEEMELSVELHGTILGLAHGHQMKGGVDKWWRNQALGRQPIGDADILITGHLHEAIVHRYGDRWHFQAPALESESTWFKHSKGDGGKPGVLTFVTAQHEWADLQYL